MLIQGEESTVRFDGANKLYEQGKYAEAISAYQQLVQESQVSAALYFNLGNAYFKNGQPGHAISFFLLAQRLAPRDPDVAANLRFARETVAGAQFRSSPWERWISILTLNELSLTVMLLLWLLFTMLAATEVNRSWRETLRLSIRLTGTAVLLTGLWLTFAAREKLGNPLAVVTSHEAVVRYGPFQESQSFYTVRDGVELRVLDHKDSWLQVSDRTQRIGWVQSKDLQVLPRG